MIKIIGEENENKTYVFTDTGEVIEPKYLNYKYSDYIKDGLDFFELMTAKPFKDDEQLQNMLTSNEYIAEEKLDGVRQSMVILENESRIFSRRISKKTGWYAENTNSVPHLSRIGSKTFKGTIIDGEFRIDGKEFKEVSSTMNCNWDLAIERQLELGFVTYHVFDVIYYKGVYVGKMPLWKRKKLLRKVMKAIGNHYLVETVYIDNKVEVPFNKNIPCVKKQQENLTRFKLAYPNLFEVIGHYSLQDLQKGKKLLLDKQQWYEYIVANGGEGLMLKSKQGLYKHKRGREYTKMKKWSTWDCVILGFNKPTREYNGDNLDDWEYWEYDDKKVYKGIYIGKDGRNFPNSEPVSKYYANKWVGNMIFGLYKEYTHKEILDIYGKDLDTAIDIEEVYPTVNEDGEQVYLSLIKVGECSGYDEDMRKYLTLNRHDLVGTCVEIKAQEVIDKKTGTLRHPNFLRLRKDKDPLTCTLENHLA